MSGGPDSVFLYYFLKNIKEEYNLELFFAHINHLLRGKNADADEKFVKKLGEKENIETFILREDVKEYSLNHKLSIEEAGREVRYNYFEKIKEEKNADKVALAHNLDDNVETFLFRMMRGTSLNGLCGIPLIRDFYIRPIMNIYKKDILDYLKENNYKYAIDESNEENIYTRNKIRLELIPYIEKNFNINFKEKINNLINEINEVENYFKQNIDLLSFVEKDNSINIEKIAIFPIYIKSKIIHNYLKISNINYNQNKIKDIISILETEGSKQIDIDKEFVLKKDYNKIYIEKINKCDKIDVNETILEIGKSIKYNNYIINSEIKILYDNDRIIRNKNMIFLDYNKLNDKKKFIIRKRNEGDIFFPKGMKGKKKLKEFFINEKISKFERDSIPIVINGENIVWVAGKRESENYKIDNNTEKVVVLHIEEVNINE